MADIPKAPLRMRLSAAWECLKARSMLVIVDGREVAQAMKKRHAKHTATIAGAYSALYAHRLGLHSQAAINKKQRRIIENEEET